MFDDLGDVLSQQYGGSNVVHTIKSYSDKSAALSHKANDLTQNFRRYYSNTVSDAERQNTINLFLGVFRYRKRGERRSEFLDFQYSTCPSLSVGRLVRRSLSGPATSHRPQTSISTTRVCASLFMHPCESPNGYRIGQLLQNILLIYILVLCTHTHNLVVLNSRLHKKVDLKYII